MHLHIDIKRVCMLSGKKMLCHFVWLPSISMAFVISQWKQWNNLNVSHSMHHFHRTNDCVRVSFGWWKTNGFALHVVTKQIVYVFTLRYGNIYEYKSHHIHVPNSFHRTEPNENWWIGVQWKECVWNAQPMKLFDCFHFNHLIMTDSYAYIIQCQKKWIVGHIMRFAFNSIFPPELCAYFSTTNQSWKKKNAN